MIGLLSYLQTMGADQALMLRTPQARFFMIGLRSYLQTRGAAPV